MFATKLKELRKNKKGFTLVEIIVVLVILAILAGALTPTMIGFINESRGKALIAEARVGIMAAQVCIVENPDLRTSTDSDAVAFRATPATNEKFAALATDVISGTGAGVFTLVTADSQGHVTGITYTKGDRWVRIASTGVTIGTVSP